MEVLNLSLRDLHERYILLFISEMAYYIMLMFITMYCKPPSHNPPFERVGYISYTGEVQALQVVSIKRAASRFKWIRSKNAMNSLTTLDYTSLQMGPRSLRRERVSHFVINVVNGFQRFKLMNRLKN